MDQPAAPATEFKPLIAGRTCGDCAMCCKTLEIPELNKPYNTWCVNCIDYAGCGIYDTRPQRCRDYFCYFMGSNLGEEWRPNKCRMIISEYADRLLIMVDPARPDAWRKEPYFSTMKRWSGQISVYVMLNKTTYAIFPDHVDNLGEVTDDHQIIIYEEQTANGPRKRAERILKSEVPEHLRQPNV